MNIQEQRKAIYELETTIEQALDGFRSKAKLDVCKITVQNLFDKELSAYPALKVNVEIYSHQG